MPSYLLKKQDVVNFTNNPLSVSKVSYLAAYLAPEQLLARLLPAPLQLEEPIIYLEISKIKTASYAEPFTFVAFSTLASLNQLIGVYPLAAFTAGSGAEAALIVGHKNHCLPLKLAQKINFEEEKGRLKHYFNAQLIRNNHALIDFHFVTGAVNADPLTTNLNIDPIELAKQDKYLQFAIDYQLQQQKVESARLVTLKHQRIINKSENGSFNLTLHASIDDPLTELLCLKEIGAIRLEVQTETIQSQTNLVQLNPEEVTKYLITSRYDSKLYQSI